MKIRVDIPADEVRRERVEQATFTRLDAMRSALEVPAGSRARVEHAVFEQLSAMRGIERAEAIAPLSPRRRWLPYLAFAGAAAAIVVVVLAVRGGDAGAREPVISHHVVPPGGGPSRWTSADAVVDAFADTSVEERIADDGVTLTLARGKVDCEVEPRAGRTPFRVVAGDVTVTVVGTRFAVQRTATGVRVDVARGKVLVTSPTGESLIVAGDTWSSEPPILSARTITAAAPPPPPVVDPRVEPPRVDLAQIDLEPVKEKPVASSKDVFERAGRLERTDLPASARMYRKAADGRDPTYAALSLYSLAELERRRGGGTTALRVIDEYLRRFPRGTNVEELLWIRIDIHRTAKQTAEMSAAARDYLRRFPSGTYAKPVQKLIAQ